MKFLQFWSVSKLQSDWLDQGFKLLGLIYDVVRAMVHIHVVVYNIVWLIKVCSQSLTQHKETMSGTWQTSVGKQSYESRQPLQMSTQIRIQIAYPPGCDDGMNEVMLECCACIVLKWFAQFAYRQCQLDKGGVGSPFTFLVVYIFFQIVTIERSMYQGQPRSQALLEREYISQGEPGIFST